MSTRSTCRHGIRSTRPSIKSSSTGATCRPGSRKSSGSPRSANGREGRGPNGSGGILTFRGWPLAHFVLRFTLYEPKDWDDWNVFHPHVFAPPQGRFPKPYVV